MKTADDSKEWGRFDSFGEAVCNASCITHFEGEGMFHAVEQVAVYSQPASHSTRLPLPTMQMLRYIAYLHLPLQPFMRSWLQQSTA